MRSASADRLQSLCKLIPVDRPHRPDHQNRLTNCPDLGPFLELLSQLLKDRTRPRHAIDNNADGWDRSAVRDVLEMVSRTADLIHDRRNALGEVSVVFSFGLGFRRSHETGGLGGVQAPF